MPRYVAFLRGVSPQNARMEDLKKIFESAGFTNVITVISSGNVVFNTRRTDLARLEAYIETTMRQQLGHVFPVFVRSLKALQAMAHANPYGAFPIPPQAKRVVTFLRAPVDTVALPLLAGKVWVLSTCGCEVFTVYDPAEQPPSFMRLLEKNFGKNITTRTWHTVQKCAAT